MKVTYARLITEWNSLGYSRYLGNVLITIIASTPSLVAKAHVIPSRSDQTITGGCVASADV